MNIIFINIFFVGFMVSEIPRVSVFFYFRLLKLANSLNIINICGCIIWKSLARKQLTHSLSNQIESITNAN